MALSLAVHRALPSLSAPASLLCGSLNVTLHIFLDFKYCFFSPSDVVFFAEPVFFVFPGNGDVFLTTFFLMPDFFVTDFFFLDVPILFSFK